MDIDNVVVVIGSHALIWHGIDIERIPQDSDYIMTYNKFESYIQDCKDYDHKPLQYYPISNGKKFVSKRATQIDEIEIAWDDSTASELMKFIDTDVDTIKINLKDKLNIDNLSVKEFWIPSLDVLYTLKMSHRFLKNSPHFEKTRNDILRLRKLGAKIFDQNWYKKREQETYNYSHPALNVKKNDFFKDETFYKYDHDDIHEAVKIGNKPAYTKILVPGEQVKCSAELFNNLPFIQQMWCAIEEVRVLTLERGLIPNDFNVNPYKMYKIAAQKVCTSITSGWFRDFCWDNYDLIIETYEKELMYNDNFVDKFKKALYDGKVRNFKHDRSYK